MVDLSIVTNECYRIPLGVSNHALGLHHTNMSALNNDTFAFKMTVHDRDVDNVMHEDELRKEVRMHFFIFRTMVPTLLSPDSFMHFQTIKLAMHLKMLSWVYFHCQ